MSQATSFPPRTLRQICLWFLPYAWRRRGGLASVIATMLAKTGMDVLKPWPMVFLLDYVLKRQPMPEPISNLVNALPGTSTQDGLILWGVGATVVFFILGWVLGLASAFANIAFGQRMVYDLAADLFSHLQRLSLRFHSRKAVGDNIRRVTTDCVCVSTIVKDALLPVATSLIGLASMFSIMWKIDPVLTIMALAVVPLMMNAFRLYAQPMMDHSYAQQEAEGKIYSFVDEKLNALPVVQAFSREAATDAEFASVHRTALSATMRVTHAQLQFKVLLGFASVLGTAGIFWFGAQHALKGELTVGKIVLFLSYLGSLYGPIEAMMYTSSTLNQAAGSARRVLEIFDTDEEVADRPDAVSVGAVRGEVRFEHVSFGYEPGRPVLRDLSFTVAPGQRVALVGPTGTGKSTLISLIPRFFDPQQGRVLLDGRDLRDLKLLELRQQIALVLQEPFLFPLSIAENIAYGKPDASLAQIEAAAKAANAHEFITRLPQGYQTVIGERGATLSGGERQRLAIARALLKDAPILILDEPTSALDAQTEAGLMEALDRLMKGRTTFIIAHRLATVRSADSILVLDHGRLVEHGSHSQLLAQNGLYARLHQLQFGEKASPTTPTA